MRLLSQEGPQIASGEEALKSGRIHFTIESRKIWLVQCPLLSISYKLQAFYLTSMNLLRAAEGGLNQFRLQEDTARLLLHNRSPEGS